MPTHSPNNVQRKRSNRRRQARSCACLCALVIGSFGPLGFGAGYARAETVWLVTSAADSGPGTLRQAIADANATPGHDRIHFAISPGIAHTITLTSELPTIQDAVTIDASTQPGYAGQPVVMLDGRNARGSSGLVFGGVLTATAGSTVKALAVSGFDNIGINFAGSGPYTLQDSFVGVGLSGEEALPNLFRGVYWAGSGGLVQNNVIVGDRGQTALFVVGDDNVVDGNRVGVGQSGARGLGGTAFGMLLGGQRNRLQNNVVGGNFSGIYLQAPAHDTIISGNAITQNNGNGIVLNSSRNRITANTIAMNGLAGISMQAGEGNAVRANAIYSNTALGIDIDPPGQPNNNDVLDADSGPNQMQNAPVLVAASAFSSGLSLGLYLLSTPNQVFEVDVFANDTCNGGTNTGRFGGDYGEGQLFLGTLTLRTDTQGYIGASQQLTTPQALALPSQTYLTLTATDANGNTSEFSPCYQLIPTRWLALFAFAFDNQPGGVGDLAPHYPEVERQLVQASTGQADKTAIILRDLGGAADNTRVVLVHDGISMTLSGLPDPSGALSPTLAEYDMADDEALGGFLRWARTNFPAEKSYLEIQGHGTALAPDTNYAALFAPAPLAWAVAHNQDAVPLPRWVDMKDGFTDARSRNVFSVPALARALHAGTAGGMAKFDVVNLSHCFAATIEELYEVAPYAQALVAAPNYDYLLTEAPAQIFASLNANTSAGQTARTVVQRLHAALPVWLHPGMYVAVDAELLRQVKPLWDALSTAIMISFESDSATTQARLRSAYLGSAKYDTSQCIPDWSLRLPDALVDLHTFGLQVADQFGSGSAVGRAALSATVQLGKAVLETQSRDGVPWFAGVPTVTLLTSWVFTGTGVGLYADLEGIRPAGAPANRAELNWQAHWYTHTTSANNPSPYAFISPQASRPGTYTWADVLQRYWRDTSVTTVACLSPLNTQLRQAWLPFVTR